MNFLGDDLPGPLGRSQSQNWVIMIPEWDKTVKITYDSRHWQIHKNKYRFVEIAIKSAVFANQSAKLTNNVVGTICRDNKRRVENYGMSSRKAKYSNPNAMPGTKLLVSERFCGNVRGQYAVTALIRVP